MSDPTSHVEPAADDKVKLAIDTIKNMTDEQRKNVLAAVGGASTIPQVASIIPQQGGISQNILDFVVKWISVAFIVVLVGAAIALGYAVLFVNKAEHPPDVLVTIFTTSVGFLGGLLAPTSGGGQQKPPPGH